MKITIHRGTKEVGGTCIEVSTAQSRIVLDVGLPLFDENREPLDSFRLRRATKNELAVQGILPKVAGLFDGNSSPNAILLSHAHMDHTGLLEHSQPSIPIYASRGTSKMMLAGGIFANQVSLPRDRFRELKPERPRKIGDLTVTAFPVDHSIHGCLAFLLEGQGKSVLYTGDLRLHGRKTGMAKRLVECLSGKTVDAMLMEGTHFGLPDGNDVTEYELEDEIVEHVAAAPGLALASFSPQHIDRLVAFIRTVIKTKRTFVADVYTAFVLHLLSQEINVPRPDDRGLVRVYYPQSFVASVERRRLGKIADMFEEHRIELQEILAKPKKHLMVFRPSMLEPDFGGELPRQTTCLYSRWKGYLNQPDWQQAKDVIEQAEGKLIEVHTSGHMLSRDIAGFVQSISPKTLIPVHTFEPKQFQQHHDNVLLMDDGEPWMVE